PTHEPGAYDLIASILHHAHALLPLHSFPTRRSSDLCQPPFPNLLMRQNILSQKGIKISFYVNAESVHMKRRRETRLIFQRYRFRSEEHTSELQSRFDLVCRLLLDKKERRHRSASQNT